MPIEIYRSTDTDAPVLTGEVGSLINVLDACLVNGYGSKAALGWTKPYSDTNKAVYRMNVGTGFYMRVVDEGTIRDARLAHIRGYESMSSVDAGVGDFPGSAVSPYGMQVMKSNAFDATSREWWLASDGYLIHFLCRFFVSTAIYTDGFSFGDFVSLLTTDAYNCMLCGNYFDTGYGSGNMRYGAAAGVNRLPCYPYHSIARNYNGDAGYSPGVWMTAAMGSMTSIAALGSPSGSNIVHPSAAGNGPYLAPIWLAEGSTTAADCKFRGIVPGLLAPFHDRPFTHDQSIVGSGDLSGKTLLPINVRYSTTEGQAVLELTGPWR